MKISDKHKQFCEEYIANGYNGSKAYSIVYNNKNKNTCAVEASKLLRLPRITNYLEETEANYRIIGHQIGVDRKMVMKTLKSLLTAKKGIYNKGIKMASEADHTAVNNAINTLCKIFGDFAPEKTELVIEDEGLDIDPSKLSKKEKAALKKKLLKIL